MKQNKMILFWCGNLDAKNLHFLMKILWNTWIPKQSSFIDMQNYSDETWLI